MTIKVERTLLIDWNWRMWEETINRTCKVDWRHNIVSVYMILVWLYVSCCVVAIINESLTHSSIPADPFSHFTEHHQQHRHLSRYVRYSLWIAVSCLSNLVDSKVSIWFIENNIVVIIIVNIRLALLLMTHPNVIYVMTLSQLNDKSPGLSLFQF